MFRSIPPPPPTTETLNVIKTTQCNEEEFEDICDFDPQITVSGFNPTPNSFPASTTPTVVTLDPGEYNVDEQGFISALEACMPLVLMEDNLYWQYCHLYQFQ